MKFGLLLIMLAFASENQENKIESTKNEERFNQKNADNLILVKIEEDEYSKAHNKTSKYIGVSYNESNEMWRAQRRNFRNGSYKDEETAAHASDTLARKLMVNGEQNLKLNFPNDSSEVHPKNKKSTYIGVSYNESKGSWSAQRWSKRESKMVTNGTYKDEETAAHASDTLARKLVANGEQNHRLNFSDDHTEVNLEEKVTSSKFIGVSFYKSKRKWYASRRSKNENKMIFYGYFADESAAAHASDALSRKLTANGEQNHKLNFPDEDSKHQKMKRKRSECDDMDHFQNK